MKAVKIIVHYLIIILSVIFIALSAAGLFFGTRYIDNRLLVSNEQRAMDLALIVSKNFHVTDDEVEYMRSLTFNEMEADPVNHRLTDVGTGVKLGAPTISIYIVAPVDRVRYYTDETNADFFGLEEGTALDSVWLFNAAIDEEGNPVFVEREDIYRYTHTTEEIQYGYDNRQAFGTYSVDEWGEVITGYAPVYTDEGNFVGMLGIDMDVDEYQHSVHKMILLFIAVYFAVTLVLLGLFILFYSKYSKVEKSKMYFEFYSRMSHDMRTPMNGIIGLVHLSESEDDVEELHNYFGKIGRSGQYLLQLINDTLDVGRISHGQMKLRKETISMSEMLGGIVDMIRADAADKNITVSNNVDSVKEDIYVVTDSLRFKQIFMNLFSNAVKFTPVGGQIDFNVSTINTGNSTIHCSFTVKDSGIGMSSDFVEHALFTPFSQETNSFSSKYTGSGLGLSIVKYIIDEMGGTIEVKSEPGKGTAFIIELNMTASDRKSYEAEYTARKVNKEDIHKLLNGSHILICEDHPLNAEIAQRILEKEGCIVDVAENGQRGVELFEASKPGYYDAILMDIRMPVMNGYEATVAIRKLAREDAGYIPIIAMTANAYDEDIQNSIDAGMNAHISKPFNPTLLFSALSDNIAMYRNRRK